MFRGRTYLPVIILVWSGLVTACESRSNVPIEKWEHRRADQTEFTTINRPWNPPNHRGTELHFFQARLPIFAYTEPYLYLENVDEVFEVRLNGRPIYRSGNPDSAHFTYPGAPWHLIQLQSARPGDLIELLVRSAHVNLGVLGVPAIVSYREHLGAMFRTDADRIFVSSTLLFIGIFLIGLALAIRREYAAFLYLGLFSCLMGTWIFGTTHVKQLLWNAPIFWKYIEYTSLYLIPVAIAVFLQKTIQRKSRKYLRFITFSHLLFTIAALSLALTGTVRITTTLLPFNYLMLFSMITFLALLIYWNRMGDHAARYFLYGSLFLIFFAVHDILANLDLIAWNRAFSHWGALAFTISLSVLLVREIQNTRVRLREVNTELALARDIQQSLLPASPAHTAGIRVHVLYNPAQEVGGDYYDFAPSDEHRLGVLIADVTGHGLSAALIANMMRVSFSAAVQHDSQPERVLEGMNKILYGQCGNQFISAGYILFDQVDQTAMAGIAGHPAPILIRNGQVRELQLRGPVLGWQRNIRIQAERIPIQSGDRFFCFTDGAIEVRNNAGQIFGYDRFFELVAKEHHKAPADFIQGILVEIFGWHGSRNLEDDITFVVVDVA